MKGFYYCFQSGNLRELQLRQKGTGPRYLLTDDNQELLESVKHFEDASMCPHSTCHLKFESNVHLFSHQQTTKHFRNYCCLCRRPYSSRCKMIRHIETVHKTTKYTCWICCKSYCRSDVLTAHQMAVHNMVACKICNATFPEREMLKDHMQTLH